MLEPSSEPAVQIAFTVKELLARIETKIDALAEIVDKKASQESVNHVEMRVETLEKRVGKLESFQGWVKGGVGLLAGIFALLIPIATHYLPG